MMKKLICIMVVLLLTASMATAEPLTVKNHSFELLGGVPQTGKLMGVTPDDWTFAGGPNGGNGGGIENPSSEGEVCAAVNGTDSIFQLTDHTITAGDAYTLTFDAYYLWSSSTINCTMQGRLYYDDGGARTVIDYVEDTVTDTDYLVWHYDYTKDVSILTGNPAIGNKLGIELSTAQAGDSWFGFDNIRLENESPLIAKIPDPYNGEELVEPNKVLGWSPPPAFTPSGYNVYLDPNEDRIIGATTGTPVRPTPGGVLYKSLNQPGASYDPALDLANNTWYYWRVDSIETYTSGDDPNTFTGTVWSFKTLPEEPIINTHPQGQTVPATTDATFTVEADNATDYQWYYALTPYDNDLGTEMAGKTDPSLTITGVGLGQEGYYYCNVANGATPAGINSEKALLMTERLFAQWTFENTIDAVVGGFTGTYIDPNDTTPDPEFDNTVPSPAGGYAIKFDGDTAESAGSDNGEFVEVSEPNVFDFYPQGLTASAWVTQVDAGNGWSCIVSKEQRAVSPWIGWVLNASNGPYGGFTIRQATNADTSAPDLTGVNEDLGNNWHLVTGTYDGETVSIYVDGDLKNTGTSSVVVDPIPGEPLRIGVETFEGLSPWNGLIDNLQIYTHALSRVEVAVMYTDQVPGAVICTEDMSDTDMDFNDDCITNLKDFAELAAKWLECYIVPTCIN